MASERISSYEYTSSSYDTSSSDLGRGIKSMIAPRCLVFQRLPAGSASGRQSNQFSGSSSSALVQGGGFMGAAGTEVASIKTERDNEKKAMQDLNSRFASYIEKVRFLDAQNRKLTAELDKLKAKWGKQSTLIKAMYQTELDEAKRLLEEAEKEKCRLEIKICALEEQLEELRRKLEEARCGMNECREKLERQFQQLSDYEAEMNLLKRRSELLEGDRIVDKKSIVRVQDCLNRARMDLDNETLLHVDAENRRCALEEELEFIKQCHEQELRELAALAYRDTTNENRDLWKSEMGSALKALQMEYDDKIDNLRGEMDMFYNLKVQEFRTAGGRQGSDVSHSREEITRLKTQTGDLRGKIGEIESKNHRLQSEIDEIRRQMAEKDGEMEDENSRLQSELAKLCAEKEGIMKEFQNIMDLKLSLELEISAYRKLLDGEENRDGLKQVVDSMFSQINNIGHSRVEYGGSSHAGEASHSAESSLSVRSEVRGQMSGRTTYQRSAKGPVAIAECSADFIVLENTGRKEEDLSGWCLKRNIDGSDKPSINIPSGTVLRSGSKFKFWARGQLPPNAPSNEAETNESTFGQGKDISTKLLNPAGEDRATHIQKTSFA